MEVCNRMKTFFKSVWGIITLSAAGLILLGGIAFGGYEYWLYTQPKFQDVTVELGTDTVSLSSFFTKYAKAEKAAFACDLSAVDLNQAGDTPLTLRHGRKEESVVLHVVDTTAPQATFITQLTKPAGYEPQTQDFVTDITDLSETTVSFKEQPVVPQDYTDLPVTVVVADIHGNTIEQLCTVTYSWMHDKVSLELGEKLTPAHILMDAEKDAALLDQTRLDEISAAGVGEYTVETTSGGRTAVCTVTVADTKAPALKLKEKTVYVGGSAKLSDFVESAEDPSGKAELKLLSKLDCTKKGSYTVKIEATDIYGNTVTGETKLHVVTDKNPPSISGLSAMTVNKNSSPDFLKGVSANDSRDGKCTVSCNTDGVDLTKAGTYYAVYTATDKSGNTATSKRKVVVNHDSADTAALVAEIAAKLSSDPLEIRNYVRKIAYSTSWGGSDPVWYGFKNWTGNCYVHALCLQKLLQAKGYQTQLIWMREEYNPHYWVLIHYNGKWWHIDATPSYSHMRYDLMTDEQRLDCLKGRKWDFDKWPSCG